MSKHFDDLEVNGIFTIIGLGDTSATDTLLLKGSGGTTNVVFEDGGDVGIGTAAPSARFHVKGANDSAAVYSFRVENLTNNKNITYDGAGTLINDGVTRSQLIVAGSDSLAETASAPLSSYSQGASAKMAEFHAHTGSGKIEFTTTTANPYMKFYDTSNVLQTQFSVGGGPPNFIKQRIAFGHAVPVAGSMVHTKSGDIIFEGTGGDNTFFMDESTARLGIGTAAPTSKLHTVGNVNLDNGLATFNKTPVSNKNVEFSTEGLTANGVGFNVKNSQAITGSLTTMQISKTGANTANNVALDLQANGSLGNDFALRFIQGDFIASHGGSKFTLGGGYGRVATRRFEVVNIDTEAWETLHYAQSKQTAKNNYMFEAHCVASQTLANKESVGFFGFLGGASTVNAEKYGSKITLSPNNANAADMYGHYVHLSSNNTVTDTVTNWGYKIETYAGGNTNIDRGDFIGFEADMGTSSSTQIIDSFLGMNIQMSHNTSSTVTSAIGLNIDMGNSETVATTAYAAIINGGNVGIGTATPSEVLHVVDGATDFKFTEATTESKITIDGNASKIISFSATDAINGGLAVGVRGDTEASFPGYGKQGDGFVYSSVDQNGLNIISAPGTGTEDYIKFYAGQEANGGTADMYIDGTGATMGNIGMGTETPTAKLHVKGGDVLLEGTGSDNTLFMDESTARVGIGTASPSSKLHVVGQSLFTDIVETNGQASATLFVSTTPTTLVATNEVIFVQPTIVSGNMTVNMPTLASLKDGQMFTFRRTNSSGQSCTLAPNGASWSHIGGGTANPTIASNASRKWVYRTSNTTWYEIT